MSEGGHQLPLTLPRDPPNGQTLREACAFLRPSLPVKLPQQKKGTITTPQVYGRKKIKGFFFCFKGVFFFPKSHSQFENKYPGHIVLNQYLAAHSVGLRGTECNSKISKQIIIILILYFLKISFWMLKEIATIKVNAPKDGCGYIHPRARPSSKHLTAHHDTRVRFNHAQSDHTLAVITNLMQDEASQGPSSVEVVTFSSEAFIVWVAKAASSEAEGSTDTASLSGLGCDQSLKVKSLLLLWKPGCSYPLVDYFAI